jgi:ABC-type Fe3+ transport system permease subunit
MDLSVLLFCVCVVLCVGSGLATGPPSKESYRLCIDEETERTAKAHKGFRARVIVVVAVLLIIVVVVLVVVLVVVIIQSFVYIRAEINNQWPITETPR